MKSNRTNRRMYKFIVHKTRDKSCCPCFPPPLPQAGLEELHCQPGAPPHDDDDDDNDDDGDANDDEDDDDDDEDYPRPALRSFPVRPEHLLMWHSRETRPEKGAWRVVAV